jgi:hypothetical protein
LSIVTIGGSNKKAENSVAKLRPDDELMLTNVQHDVQGDGASEETSHEMNHIHMQRDYDVEWTSQKTRSQE